MAMLLAAGSGGGSGSNRTESARSDHRPRSGLNGARRPRFPGDRDPVRAPFGPERGQVHHTCGHRPTLGAWLLPAPTPSTSSHAAVRSPMGSRAPRRAR